MSRRIMVLLVVLVPVLLLANAFQSYRHNQLEKEITRLEREQLALIEENKRAILAISVLSSPQRIGPLAEEELGLERVDAAQIIRMRTAGVGESK